MAFYQLKRDQIVQTDLNTLWDFISNPANLKEITPNYMGFDIISKDLPQRMYAGMIIEYRVSPLLNIPTTWVTEITHVVDKQYFVDEQRVGPYKMWHHQHILKPGAEGVMMTDIVSYRPPFPILGAFANQLVIKRKLNEIFQYRSEVIDTIFNNPNE